MSNAVGAGSKAASGARVSSSSLRAEQSSVMDEEREDLAVGAAPHHSARGHPIGSGTCSLGAPCIGFMRKLESEGRLSEVEQAQVVE